MVINYIFFSFNFLGWCLWGRDKEEWFEWINRVFKFFYDVLLYNEKEKLIFCYIVCFFNFEKVCDILWLLEDSDLGVEIGFNNLVDKFFVYVREDIIEMYCLL